MFHEKNDITIKFIVIGSPNNFFTVLLTYFFEFLSGDKKWIFYSEKDFKGTKLELGPGSHNLNALKKVGNDNIRSVEKTGRYS